MILRLIPAAALVAFAAWGLVPLVRLGRTIFLNVFTSSTRLCIPLHPLIGCLTLTDFFIFIFFAEN